MSKQQRSVFFVDRRVQGVLVARAALYWVYCLLAVLTFVTLWTAFQQKPESSSQLFGTVWANLAPALLAAFLLLPLVLVDLVRFSNRFAGPALRLRRALQDLAAGDRVEPIQFRHNDFWQEFADSFNTLLAERCGESSSATDVVAEPQHQA